MSTSTHDARRIARLLRWYPPSWRERYGEEFADHLEQEFADRRVDLRRSLNVAYKGIVARVDDLGLSNASMTPGGQTRAALGTSVILITITAVLAINFWSWAMLQWSARHYHPVPVDTTTGVLTVATGLLVLALVTMVLIVLASAVRQIARGRGRPVITPAVLAVGSLAFLYYSVPWLPRMFVEYSHMAQGGYRWTHPGPAAYGLAAISHSVTQRWVSMWDPGIVGAPTSTTVMDDLAPLAVLVFAVSMAFLVRRVEIRSVSARLGSATVVLFGALSGVLLVTFVLWFTGGGPIFATFGETGDIAGVSYLVFMAIVTVLVGRMGLLARRIEPPQKRNHIRIIG
ncbi:MAG: hypothetical protein WA580_04510 [Acidimicrobiales bacterium]